MTAEGTNTLCDGEEITGDLTGQIALISRGGCYFSDKVWNAQQAGAIAAINGVAYAGGLEWADELEHVGFLERNSHERQLNQNNALIVNDASTPW